VLKLTLLRTRASKSKFLTPRAAVGGGSLEGGDA
jgi:hypothetical protein